MTQPNPPTHLVFVYGTLKSGHGNNRLLVEGNAPLLGQAVTVAKLFLADHGIPYVWTEGGPLHQVRGELYEVNDRTLARLDRLEGHPHAYRRELTQVVCHGATVEAGIYMYPGLAAAAHQNEAAEIVDGCYEWGRQ